MNTIKKITFTEDIALITFRNSPSNVKFMAHVFDIIASKGINVDMISQTAPIGEKINLSFTIADGDLGNLLELFVPLRAEFPFIKYDISSGNCKISLYEENMKSIPGIAAKVFDTIAELNIDIRIITTSEVDISILIPISEINKAKEAFL